MPSSRLRSIRGSRRRAHREPDARYQSARELSDGLASVFSLPDSLQGSQPRFSPVVARSQRPPANTRDVFAPTELDASTPGVREGVSRDATLQSTGDTGAGTSRGWIIGLVLAVGAIGLAAGLGLPRLLDREDSQQPTGVVAEAASVTHAVGVVDTDPVETTEPAAPSASAPIVAVASASAEPAPTPPTTVKARPVVNTAGKATGKAPPAKTTAPPAETTPPTTPTPPPPNEDDIW